LEAYAKDYPYIGIRDLLLAGMLAASPMQCNANRKAAMELETMQQTKCHILAGHHVEQKHKQAAEEQRSYGGGTHCAVLRVDDRVARARINISSKLFLRFEVILNISEYTSQINSSPPTRKYFSSIANRAVLRR
jgi:hypothetical protein